jgi:hypothetical protein
MANEGYVAIPIEELLQHRLHMSQGYVLGLAEQKFLSNITLTAGRFVKCKALDHQYELKWQYTDASHVED